MDDTDAVAIRPAVASDRALLDAMLVETVNWDPRRPPRRATDVLTDPMLLRYVAGWPRPDDLGVVAVAAGEDVGAAWCRHFGAATPGYGFVDEHTPEVSIALAGPWRGKGLGRRLLVGLAEAARAAGRPRLSLSVERGNPARHLYEWVGYAEVGGGTDAAVMVVVLEPDQGARGAPR